MTGFGSASVEEGDLRTVVEVRSVNNRYLKIVGGFLSVEVKRDAGKPVAIFRHHGVDGAVLNEVIMKAE